MTMSAQPAKPIFAGDLPAGLQRISNIVAVSSCKVNVSEPFGYCLSEFIGMQICLYLL